MSNWALLSVAFFSINFAKITVALSISLTDGLFVGYSYDRETTKLSNYNSGSHEIFLRFELFNKFSKMVSPRFF